MKKLLYTFAFIVFISCEKEIEMDLPEQEPVLVLNAFISPDSSINVMLSKSEGALENKSTTYIDGAKLILYENNVQISELDFKGQGMYVAAGIKAVIGRNYRIKAEKDGFNPVEASSSIPEVLPFQSYQMLDSAFLNYEKKYFTKLQFSFLDKSEAHHYYSFELFRADSVPSSGQWQILGYSRVDLDSDEPNLIKYEDEWLLDDELLNGSEINLSFYFPSAIYNGVKSVPMQSFLFVKINSVSKEYYMYKKTLRSYRQSSGNPFAEPVRVYSNIENGLGIFGGYASSMNRIIP